MEFMSTKYLPAGICESSPVYASHRGEDPEGRMTELVNASEMVSREKHPWEGNGPLSMCQTVMTKKEKPIVANGETPRPECDLTATGKEQEKESGAAGCNEETGLKPKGRLEADLIRGQLLNLSCKQKMKIGTWNVRSMQSGKMNIIQREMKRLEISIMGLSETRWKGQGHFN